jgi:hypothetical protein
MRGTATTTRNRPCECADGCGYRLRLSRAMIARGLPRCPCGALIVPSTIEDALAAHELGHLTDADLEAHGEWSEYSAALASAQHGQASHVRRGRTVRPAETVAMERVYEARATVAYANRIAALHEHAFGASTPDEIPF